MLSYFLLSEDVFRMRGLFVVAQQNHEGGEICHFFPAQ
jgi:hypothetical protein